MTLLKFKDFKTKRNEILEAKKQEEINEDFELVFEQKLKELGVSSPAELNADDLSKFLDSLKEYRNKSAYDIHDKNSQLRKTQSDAIRQIVAKSKDLKSAVDAVKKYLSGVKVQYEAVNVDTTEGAINVYLQGTKYEFKTPLKEGVEEEVHPDEIIVTMTEEVFVPEEGKEESGKETGGAGSAGSSGKEGKESSGDSDLNKAEKAKDVEELNKLVADLQDGESGKAVIQKFTSGEMDKDEALAKLKALAGGSQIA